MCLNCVCVLQEVAKVYEQLKDSNWYEVDASQSIDKIHKEIWGKASATVDTVSDKEIEKLWI